MCTQEEANANVYTHCVIQVSLTHIYTIVQTQSASEFIKFNIRLYNYRIIGFRSGGN